MGAGDGPCLMITVGTRRRAGVRYPVVDVALKHRAGVEKETTSSHEAYAGFPEFTGAPYREGDLPAWVSATGG